MNRVQITDGTAAVSADERILAKASHWGRPEKADPVDESFERRKSEELLWRGTVPDGISGLFDIATENDGCSDDPMGSSLFFRRF